MQKAIFLQKIWLEMATKHFVKELLFLVKASPLLLLLVWQLVERQVYFLTAQLVQVQQASLVKLLRVLQEQVFLLLALIQPYIVFQLVSFVLEARVLVFVKVEVLFQVPSWEQAVLVPFLFCLNFLQAFSQHIFTSFQQVWKLLSQLWEDFMFALMERLRSLSLLAIILLCIQVSFIRVSDFYAKLVPLWLGIQVYLSYYSYFNSSIFPWRIEVFFLCVIFLSLGQIFLLFQSLSQVMCTYTIFQEVIFLSFGLSCRSFLSIASLFGVRGQLDPFAVLSILSLFSTFSYYLQFVDKDLVTTVAFLIYLQKDIILI